MSNDVFYTGYKTDTYIVFAKHRCSETQVGNLMPTYDKLDQMFAGSTVQYPHQCDACGAQVVLSEASHCFRYVPAGETYDFENHAPQVTATLKSL